MAEKEVDILIIGGGLTGASLMIALRQLGYSTKLVEAVPFSAKIKDQFDARSIALSMASVRILQRLEVWPLLKDHAMAIEKIHISERRRFGRATLQNNEQKPLGYVVEMPYIHRALHPLLPQQDLLMPAKLIALDRAKSTVTLRDASGETLLTPRLIVAADGAESSVRHFCELSSDVKDYGQQAIVTNIGLARAHGQQAFERFTDSGPLALLPMTNARVSLVWSLFPEDAERLMTCHDSEFLRALQTAFGYRLGRFIKVGQRMVFPLRQVVMPIQSLNNIVFVGNAAHTLHPVAGQGFNLGLRDVATLAQCIAKEGLNPLMLQTYQKMRQHDQSSIMTFTNGLIKLFASAMPFLPCLRGAGLMVLDNSALLKNILTRYTSGFAGNIPDLVCGIPLRSLDGGR